MAFSGLLESFLDIIYPMDIRCLICDNKRDDLSVYGICKWCESALPFIEPPSCPKCGKMMLADNELCHDCIDMNHTFDKGISIFEFGTEIKRLVYRYKYGGEKYLSIPMIRWMTRGLKLAEWDFDLIVPVPLHPARERMRGFNQANLLARGISKNLGKPLINKDLKRVKHTPQQAKLGKYERHKNLEGAFRIRDIKSNGGVFQDKTILLVDDIYTTGSTADQCTRVLLNAGAQRVYVITLATGSNF